MTVKLIALLTVAVMLTSTVTSSLGFGDFAFFTTKNRAKYRSMPKLPPTNSETSSNATPHQAKRLVAAIERVKKWLPENIDSEAVIESRNRVLEKVHSAMRTNGEAQDEDF